jgi:hypothetical protein
MQMMGYDACGRLHTKLTKVAELALSCVFAESALVGLLDARSTARFVARGGSTWVGSAVHVFLLLTYGSQLFTATILCVPVVTDQRVSRPTVIGTLTTLALIESIVHILSNDWDGLAKGLLLLSTCLTHLVDALSSRSRLHVNGMLDACGYKDTIDASLGRLRDTASRYRFGAHAVFLIVLSVLYTTGTSESMFASNSMRSQLAKNQWTKTMGFVALCASIGANDRRTSLSGMATSRGRKKAL